MKCVLSPIEQYVVDFVLKLRKTQGLTQADIGFVLKVGGSFISQVENPGHKAKYNLNHINALADHFDISPADFLPEKAFPVQN